MNTKVYTSRDLEKIFYENMIAIGFNNFNLDSYRDKFNKALKAVEKSNGYRFIEEDWIHKTWKEVRINMFFKYKENEHALETMPEEEREKWFSHHILQETMIAVHMNSLITND